MKASALILICTDFEDALSTCKGVPNEHLLGVISALFLKLVLAANFMIYWVEKQCHLQKCIGTAVIAIGPERILELVPISL
ncbi:hypothetical protein EV1_014215 [Malus domestica]